LVRDVAVGGYDDAVTTPRMGWRFNPLENVPLPEMAQRIVDLIALTEDTVFG
jgi:hypothetical protein